MTRDVLTSFSCEAVLINYRAYERLKKVYDISYRELVELVEIRAYPSEIMLHSKKRQVNSIKNQLQNKGYIKRSNTFPKRYILTDIGYNCLQRYSKNLTYIIHEKANELKSVTDL